MINITEDAINFITDALNKNPGKYPRIVLRNGGCAGNMLILTLDVMHQGDIECTSNGIIFISEPAVETYIDDIKICLKTGIAPEILIYNNNTRYVKCRCGKSFRA